MRGKYRHGLCHFEKRIGQFLPQPDSRGERIDHRYGVDIVETRGELGGQGLVLDQPKGVLNIGGSYRAAIVPSGSRVELEIDRERVLAPLPSAREARREARVADGVEVFSDVGEVVEHLVDDLLAQETEGDGRNEDVGVRRRRNNDRTPYFTATIAVTTPERYDS